jgi:hypothetical protein
MGSPKEAKKFLVCFIGIARCFFIDIEKATL